MNCRTCVTMLGTSTARVCSGTSFNVNNSGEKFWLCFTLTLDSMRETARTGCIEPKVLPLFMLTGVSWTLIKFIRTLSWFNSTSWEPITIPFVSASVGRHSTRHTLGASRHTLGASLLLADFPMSTSTSTTLQDLAGIVRVLPRLMR